MIIYKKDDDGRRFKSLGKFMLRCRSEWHLMTTLTNEWVELSWRKKNQKEQSSIIREIECQERGKH